VIGTEANVDALRDELEGIGRLVEEAAAREDVLEFDRLTMRERALPKLIRDARIAPLRDRLRRVEAELDALVEERRRALDEEPPEAPAAMHGTVTPLMMRQRVLDGIASRERAASQERRELLAKIAEIESGEDA